MRSYKRYTRRKRLLKQIAVVALVFILGFVLLRAVSYIAIQDEISNELIVSIYLEEKQIFLLGGICHRNAGKGLCLEEYIESLR